MAKQIHPKLRSFSFKSSQIIDNKASLLWLGDAVTHGLGAQKPIAQGIALRL